MKKYFLLLVSILFLKFSFASQIESNHSYFKNSNFLSDYEISIKGYSDIKFRSFKNGKEVLNNANSDLSLNIDIGGKIEEYFKYGVQFTQRFNNEFSRYNSYFGYIKNYYGTFEFGNTLGSTEIARIGGDSINIGNGGIFGDFSRLILSKLLPNRYFILKEGTLSNQMFGYYNSEMDSDEYDFYSYKTKFNFYSPEYYGLQFLFSFTPKNEIEYGLINKESSIFDSKEILNIGDIISYGINYVNTFDSLGVAISFIQEKNLDIFSDKNNDGNKIKKEINILSNIFGVNINYFGFTISGSYGLLERNKFKGSSTKFADIANEKINYYSLGASYEIANIAVNYNMFESKTKDIISIGTKIVNKFQSETISLEYKINKNVNLYGEYIKYKIKDLENNNQKNGSLITFGTLINFY